MYSSNNIGRVGRIGTSVSATSSTPLTAQAPTDPLFTPAGDSTFAWTTPGCTVQLAAMRAPNGKMEGARIAAVTGAANSACYKRVNAAPFADPGYVVFAKQGNSPTQANGFAIYNGSRQQLVAQCSINYATGDVIVGAGAVGAVKSKAGFWMLTLLSPAGSINAGEQYNVYAAYLDGAAPAGSFAYAWGARAFDQTAMGGTNSAASGAGTWTRGEKLALLGIGLGWLLNK